MTKLVTRVEICRDRRSCKILASCVFFSENNGFSCIIIIKVSILPINFVILQAPTWFLTETVEISQNHLNFSLIFMHLHLGLIKSNRQVEGMIMKMMTVMVMLLIKVLMMDFVM